MAPRLFIQSNDDGYGNGWIWSHHCPSYLLSIYQYICTNRSIKIICQVSKDVPKKRRPHDGSDWAGTQVVAMGRRRQSCLKQNSSVLLTEWSRLNGQEMRWLNWLSADVSGRASERERKGEGNSIIIVIIIEGSGIILIVVLPSSTVFNQQSMPQVVF